MSQKEIELIAILQDLNQCKIGVGIAADRIDKLYKKVEYPSWMKSNLNGIEFNQKDNINIINK